MNTTAIGDNFELRGLEIINKVIAEEQLGHIAKYLKVKTKERYYSHIRKGYVVFDMVIEVWPPGAKRYTLIYIIECKNYQRRVQVDKIKAFLFDINDIGFANAKAIFISNSSLQKGGYNLAESSGMMVIEAESVENYKIVLHKRNRNKDAGKIPFLIDTVDETLIDVGVELIEKLLDRQIVDALYENLDEERIGYGVDKLSKEGIEQLVNLELNKMNPDILKRLFFSGFRHLKNICQPSMVLNFYSYPLTPIFLALATLKRIR